ncbi:MAG: ABC transporter substrate-binding protein [Rhodospirillaceae bacterium]|nr:ABC transporter substrate-binding protein [Rhodospirillaceae bacterium]
MTTLVSRLLWALGIAFVAAIPVRAETLKIACPAVGIEYDLCREGAEAWAQKTGNEVQLVQTPNHADERLALFQQLLASGSAVIDVFQIDVIWPGILGRYFIDLAPLIPEADRARHFPAMIEANTVDGELKAMPWFGDAGLLYYRKDLLEKYGLAPPKTWDELTKAAQTVVAGEKATNDKLVGIVFQARAYEGLTCNALEWIASYGGGTIYDADGKVTLDNPKAAAAIDMAAGWIRSGLAPKGVLTYAEEEARGVFQSGNAVFMRNWPYAWALANSADSPVKGKVGVTVLPEGPGGRHAATLGGAALAVSKFSTHQKAAADLVAYLTSPEEEIRRAIKGSLNPTIPAAYDDPRLLEAQPVMKEFRPVLEAAVSRPARLLGSDYNRVSATFWNAVHDALSGRGSAAENLAQAARRLERITRAGG